MPLRNTLTQKHIAQLSPAADVAGGSRSRCGWRGLPSHAPLPRNDAAQTEGVVSGRDHCQGHSGLRWLGSQVLCFQPRAQPGIVDLGLAVPEIGSQSALNIEVIELQLYDRDVFGKIATNVRRAHEESGKTPAFAVCFYNHIHLLIRLGKGQFREPGSGEVIGKKGIVCSIPQ